MSKEIYEAFDVLVEELRGTNERDMKLVYIISSVKRHPEIKELLKLALDPDVTFGVTTEINTATFSLPFPIKDLLKLADDLACRKYTGHEAEERAEIFAGHSKYMGSVINKDLKAGISWKTFLSLFPDEGFDFKSHVPLAHRYDQLPKDKTIWDYCDRWYVSRKLDGIRCLCFLTREEKPRFFSRSGKQFFTLDNIFGKDFIYAEGTWKSNTSIVLDGELCIIDENGDEDFQAITKEYRRKNHTVANPMFKVFDIYSSDDFRLARIDSSTWDYTMAMECIDIEKEELLPKDCRMDSVKQTLITNQEQLDKIISEMPEHWEGLMLRADKPTEFKRSRNLLKIKKYHEAEAQVIDVLVSTKTIDGEQVRCAGSIRCKRKEGVAFDCGSGLMDDERLNFYNNPERIIGKTITFKYFQKSKDQNGKPSYRHPVFKCIRKDGE